MRRWVNVLGGVAAAGLLGTLLLSAVECAQRTKFRSECQNNVRMLALGLYGYHDVIRTFPPAVAPAPDLPPDRRLSWLLLLDPYIHARMDPAWRFDLTRPWDAEENVRLARNQLPWFTCPAAPPAAGVGGLAHASYVGAAGVGADAPTLPAGAPRAGLFGYDRTTALKDVTDGAGQTVAAIETTDGTGPWSAGGRPTTRGVDPGRRPHVGVSRSFGGLHKGGANALFVDGSVRFIRESASPETLEALFTVAAGDPPGQFEE